MFKNFFDFVGVSNQNTIQTREQFIDTFEGCTFLNGMYRLFKKKDVPKWNSIVAEAFPPATNKIEVFGYDWQGRVFAVDSESDTVLILEPGTGEGFDTDRDFIKFHNEELLQKHDFCLLSEYYQEWMDEKNQVPEHSQCVGYIVPLFLNGKDEVKNLEISDMEVYWGIMAPLINM